jgi:hypothetical protein
MEPVTEPRRSASPLFEERYPIWQCPNCKRYNRYVDTFMEPCRHCGTDHTLDWHKYIVFGRLREK